MSDVTAVPGQGPGTQRVEGPLVEFWRAYAQSRGALLGLTLTMALVLIAIFAAAIAPHSPYEQYRDFTLAPPVWHALWTKPHGRRRYAAPFRSGAGYRCIR